LIIHLGIDANLFSLLYIEKFSYRLRDLAIDVFNLISDY
jgi:hypothetical protein